MGSNQIIRISLSIPFILRPKVRIPDESKPKTDDHLCSSFEEDKRRERKGMLSHLIAGVNYRSDMGMI